MALALWSGASTLFALHTNLGPPSQIVNVRWVATASADDRQRAEADLGLTPATSGDAPVELTRSYRLSRRSDSDILRILYHPLVSDTHHIDRTSLRVDLDRPDMNAALRWLLQTDQTPLVGWGLALFGLVPLWWARRGLPLLAKDAPHVFGGHAAPRTAGLSRTEIVWSVVFAAAFLLPLLLYGQPDDEELALGVFSSQVYYRALFNGQWPFWLDTLGFGTPMPIGQRLDLHPVFALGSLVSLRVALSAVWVVHVALMVVYFQRLAVVSGIRQPLRTILLACYLISAPSLCYFYASDWVPVIVAWSLCPALIFYVRRLIHDEAETHFWEAALRLGLLAGFWVLNSHPGYLAPLACGLAVYVVASRPGVRAWACLGMAGAFACAMSAERIYFTVTEMGRFPASLPRVTQEGYALADYAAAALIPWASFDADLRLPFIGLVLGVTAAAGIPSFVRGRDVHARACGVGFAACTLLSLAPDRLMAPLRVLSGIWFFRDPMILFALLSAGMVLQAAFDAATGRWAAGLRLLLALQLVQQGALAWTGLGGIVTYRDRMQFYRHQAEPFGLARLLTDRARTSGSRLYVSEDVRTRLRGQQSTDGVHVITDLALFGLDPINGWFKGISMDRLYPSISLMHGVIAGQREVIENHALLDVLGINLVMTSEGEATPPPGMPLLESYQPIAGNPEQRRRFDLFGNPSAWPRAVLTAVEARELQLPVRAGCPHEGALCRDYGSFARTRRPGTVMLDGHDGSYTARFAPEDDDRLLFLSLMYRPEFTAHSNGQVLRVDEVGHGFLGVTVPKGVSRVQIAFAPTARVVLSWFSGVSVVALLAAFSVVSWKNRRR